MMRLMFILGFCWISLSGFSQAQEMYSDRCECLESIYMIKKDFLDNVTSQEEKITLNPLFIEKHQITWREFVSIDSRCKDLKQNAEDPPCAYEEKLGEIAGNIELVIRVIEMNGPQGCEDITPKTN